MKYEVLIHISESNGPYQNLVLEDYLLRTMNPEREIILLFYKNIDSVVIGRFQNPWLECDLCSMQQESVHLVRRQSGGGTVFHDLGNLNFSIICSKKIFDKRRNLQMISSALNNDFMLNISLNERDDLLLEGKKISGSAFRFLKDRVLHHGTLLIESDLNKLRRMLKSPISHLIIESRGVSSVPSKVINISDVTLINYINIIESIKNCFVNFYGDSIDDNIFWMNWNEVLMLERIVNFESRVDELKSKEWTLLETPFFKYEYKKDSERICRMEINKGKIVTFTFDYLI
ncbi:MAG: lipoate--protein ligase family protein [Oligoflexia bacterium]|nr:lipoate--protein ligase family protein [Oligoflexia bacterium]